MILQTRIKAYIDKVGSRQAERVLIGKASGLAGRLVRTVFLIAMCFVVMYPILYMISVSFRQPADLYDPTVIWIPKHWTMANYKEIFTVMNYVPNLIYTTQQSLISTLLNVAVCAVVGYGFARFRFPGKNLVFALVIFTIMVPPQSIAIPLYVQYFNFDYFGLGQIVKLFTGKLLKANLLNTSMVFYLPALFGMGIRSGLFIYIFRQFFRGMPKELEDAAYIDGCGAFQTFWRIMAVNAVPVFITCVLFSFVWYWNDYYLSSLFFNDAKTLSASLGTLKGALRSMGADFYSNPYLIIAQMQAASVLTILPLIVIFIVCQRQFTESIDKTGIVG